MLQPSWDGQRMELESNPKLHTCPAAFILAGGEDVELQDGQE